MTISRFTVLPTIFILFSAPLYANTSISSCAADWTDNAVRFESTIQYDDIQSKVNPTVHVLINGKRVKMMFDTGANVHTLWDASLLGQAPSLGVQRIDAHVASADGQQFEAMLADDHGNVSRQTFYLVPSSVLSADGYSGILSPQAVAADDVVFMDFDKNCFFVSPRFDIKPGSSLHIRRGRTLGNPYGVMAIPVELYGAKIPMVVDTGASGTTILASLVVSKPKGKKGPRYMDMFGAALPNEQRTRLVDMKVNGETLRSHPVVPRPTVNEKGIVDFGYIGMDILKNRAIYHDAKRNEFILLRRPKAFEHAVAERGTKTE